MRLLETTRFPSVQPQAPTVSRTARTARNDRLYPNRSSMRPPPTTPPIPSSKTAPNQYPTPSPHTFAASVRPPSPASALIVHRTVLDAPGRANQRPPWASPSMFGPDGPARLFRAIDR